MPPRAPTPVQLSAAAAEATMDGGEGRLQIVGRHKLAGNITAADQIVDIFKQRFDAGIEFIQVGDDRNFGGARPSGGLGGSRAVPAHLADVVRTESPLLAGDDSGGGLAAG